MKRATRPFSFVASTLLALVLSFAAQAEERIERPNLLKVFQEHQAVGTFVLYDPKKDQLTVVGAKRAATRYVPASTFKIVNSLIALETKAVKDENEVIPYGGQPQPVKTWMRDMSMRDAITISNVPVYQELARRVGLHAYGNWLSKLDYGNQSISTEVERFWLDGPLAISAIEQTHFVARLAQNKLPFSDHSQRLVRSILKLNEKDGHTLYVKSGWAQKIGWWVGWVEHNGRIQSFALNIDMENVEDAPKRGAIVRTLLNRLNVL
ncbi:MAG: class D beta-lactamase [Parvibaculaceae bacterium]|nr:class D beta-lactamase [Parvibaculaceae bacterium]